MVDGAHQCLDGNTSNLEQPSLLGSQLPIRHCWRPSHDVFQTQSLADLVSEPMCGQDGVDGGGRFEKTVNVVVCRVSFRGGLQTRVKEQCGEQLERPTANKCKPSVVTFARIEVRLVCDCAQRKLCI